jgi:hypothetical protein
MREGDPVNISAHYSRALVAALAAALSCSLVAADAAAWSSNGALSGHYAFTGTKTCLNTPDGFNSKQQPNVPATSDISPGSLAGVFTFDGQGGWSSNLTTLAISSAAFTGMGEVKFVPNAISVTATATGSYAVGPNGEVGMTVTAATVNILTGPPAGLTVTLTNTPPMSGQLSPDNKILLLSVTEPAVETSTLSNGAVEQRICYLSYVAAKSGPSEAR